MQKLKVLDLFSGIGGFSLGLDRSGGFETVGFCEIDPYCQAVLRQNFPGVPIFNDVRNLNYEGSVDVICGGYPCQPFSHAGKRQGASDDRHLWPPMFSLIKKYRPAWVIGENVAGHISMGLDDVLSDLESISYSVQAFVIPACAVDAPHRRDRVWIIAHRQREQDNGIGGDSERRRQPLGRQEQAAQQKHGQADTNGINGCSENVAHSEGHGRKQGAANAKGRTKRIASREEYRPGNGSEIMADAISERRRSGNGGRKNAIHAHTRGETIRAGENGEWWAVEPGVGRVANGVPRRVDRLKTLGNAVIPDIPEIVGYAILEVERALNEIRS